MKKPTPTNEDLRGKGFPELSPVEQKLLDIYWHKKELEEFLPQISGYATPKELTAITLSQLSIMEKHIVQILQIISSSGNAQQH